MKSLPLVKKPLSLSQSEAAFAVPWINPATKPIVPSANVVPAVVTAFKAPAPNLAIPH